MASMVLYDNDDWLDFKRRTEIMPSDLWPTPFLWSVYRSLCDASGYVRPWVDVYWRKYWDEINCIERTVVINKDLFEVQLDVHNFRAYEVTVKVIGNLIIVKGKHDKRPKLNAFVERQFERRYDLSSDFKIKNVSSTLSSDGILTVKAFPSVPAVQPAYIRNVPVLQTFRPSYLDN